MTSSTEMLYSSRAPNGHVRYPADITVLADMDAVAELGALTEAEPGLRQQLSERELDSALEAVADFTDLRSPSRAGHSRGVAHLAATAAAGLCGLPDREIVTLRRAALIHDVGMHGVPVASAVMATARYPAG
jgi:HD-GYP domain-containing protein (c-di-GMP phosphodiesterase class II)